MKLKHGYYDVFVRTCANYPSKIAVRYYDNGDYKHYTYSELYGVCEYISQNLLQLECNKGVIGLVSERNVIIPCLIAAAHKCSTTFMFVDPKQNLEDIAKDVSFTVIITIKLNGTDDELFGKKPDRTVKMFDMTVNFYSCDFPTKPNPKFLPFHSFIAMTSGSTGHPKHIQVPVHCIQPNIDDLTKMFNITSRDVIFFSTPLTFDPSMVEILLACMKGASLLIAPDNADILFPVNSQNAITVWQTTPSRFMQYSNRDISTKILSANSTLRILALGGEPLSSFQRLKELKDVNNKTKIFTLYGVTEMSCWACVAELDLAKLNNYREIPLGKCLSETQVLVDLQPKDNKQTGKIILVSNTRNCTILNRRGSDADNLLNYVDTGDIGEVSSGTIYYRGRRDDIIKRFGHKVNLQFVEATVMQCPKVKTCACVWLPKPTLLAVYFSSETISSQELSDFLKCKLDEKHWPDHIMRVDNLPTNDHGKISKQLLCKMYEKNTGIPQTLESTKVLFLKELKDILSKYYTYDTIKDKDFFSLGGTSFLALTMANKISLTFPEFGKMILPHLLSGHKIELIMKIVQRNLFSEDSKQKRAIKRRTSMGTISSPTTVNLNKMICIKENAQFSPVQFVKLWTFDTGKCIDATPSLVLDGFTLYVVVGSHSGKIIVMDAKTGQLQGMVSLKSRVEASVLQCHEEQPCGIVGAYDGTIVKFSLNPVAEIWRINIKCMIKSKGVCCYDKLYIASYDGNVRCIDITTGEIMSTIDICDQGISADLVLAKNEFVLLGSLSGVCTSIHTGTNVIAWRGSVGSPIFASPVLYDTEKFVIFAEVNGEIHCRTVEKGIKIWKYQGAKGNVFSSIYVRRFNHVTWQMTFGCHDQMVYSFQVKNYQPTLLWKTSLPSVVYSTPCGFGDKYILAAANNGKLCVIAAENGVIIGEYQLPNETFSSPVTFLDYIFIGCRNDHLYSIQCIINSESDTQFIRP